MRWMWMAAVGALVVGPLGCSSRQRAAAETTAAQLLISDEQEQQIGRQVKAELEQKENLRYVEDPEIVGYVNRLSEPILKAANKDRRVPWRVHVIDDPKTVNAFATPGGYLYVYTGLLLAADNDAEVAGVMGHEAGHVVGRHSARAMVNAYGLQAVTQLALGKNPGLAGQIASTIAGQGLMLAHGRDAELEADNLGARYSNTAGYTPQGLVSFFRKLQEQQGDMPGVLTFLSTHPNPGDRVAHLNKVIAENRLNASGGVGPSSQLDAVKQRIRSLPGARR
jgi:predicted Zn-dependent protease